MAPVTRPQRDGNLSSASARFPSQNEPEVITIDDDEDDEVEVTEEEEGDEEDEEEEDEEEEEEDEEEDEGDEEEDEEADGDESVEEVNENDPILYAQSPTPRVNGQAVDLGSPGFLSSADVQQALHPLRRAADRVSHQIEAFAQNLDRFRQHENRPDDTATFREACQLVKRYKLLAEDTVKELSKQDKVRKAKQTASRSTIGAGLDSSTSQDDIKLEENLKRWQLEAETWELLYNMLNVDDPITLAKSQSARESAFQSLHRYSTDREIWDAFLATDHFALENIIALQWLEKNSRSSSEEIDSLISDLENQAERGQGLWAHGWLYTKEAIKGQKRLRSWPQPLDPDDPGLTVSLLSSEKQEPLITQLDPDAVIRQNRGLQKQDQFYERATWLACWKMLRQGAGWSQIRSWSEERLENWRAVSLCGSAANADGKETGAESDDGLARFMNSRSQETWRSACSVLANEPNVEEFERAVYALLSGETEPAYRVCQSWDDYLYVFFNHSIITRYREFCKQFQRKLTFSPTENVSVKVEAAGYREIANMLNAVKTNERVGVEARNPYRTVQGAILSKSYDTFFYRQANAVSRVANTGDESRLIPDIAGKGDTDDSALIAAKDEDSLRMITHMLLVLQPLGYVRSDTDFVKMASVNVIGYIDMLQGLGGYELIPLYASLMPKEMAYDVLGKVLIDVVEPEERARQVTFMKNLNIDIEAVFDSQWEWVVSEAIATEDKDEPIILSDVVIKQQGGPGMIGTIRPGFVGRHLPPGDEMTIRSFEWHRYLDNQWDKLCELGTMLYKRFMCAGRLPAARELCMRARLSELSMEAVGVDVAELAYTNFEGDEDGFEDPSSPIKSGTSKKAKQRQRNSVRENKSRLEAMYMQSQTMRELEELILAFDALEAWADKFDELSKTKDVRKAKQLGKQLQKTLDYSTERIEPLTGEWLVNSRDEEEATQLDFIRLTYLPEVILAYHSALYTSGCTISRDNLAQCLTLAVIVARSPILTDAFVASSRMSELVDVFALSSIAVVQAGESKTRNKKLAQGASLDIWKVKPQPEGDDDEDDEDDEAADQNGVAEAAEGSEDRQMSEY